MPRNSTEKWGGKLEQEKVKSHNSEGCGFIQPIGMAYFAPLKGGGRERFVFWCVLGAEKGVTVQERIPTEA